MTFASPTPAPRFPEPPRDWDDRSRRYMEEYTRTLILWINQLNTLAYEEAAFLSTTTVTVDYDIRLTDNLLLVDTTGGNVTLTLPDPAKTIGRRFTVKRISGGGNNAIVVPFASETIDGMSSVSFNVQWRSYMFRSNGVDWHITAFVS
jgi:hypothetical protein